MSDLAKISSKYTNLCLKTDKNKTLRNLIISFSKDKNLKQGWYLISNINLNNLQNIYKNRFQIKRAFQDQKSIGFDIEKLRLQVIRNLKKLLYCTHSAQNLLLFLGEYISENVDNIKKSRQKFY